VVDDHRAFGDALRIAMDLQPGVRCRRAEPSAEAALEAIDAGASPDVVLLDVGLPGMDGPTAVRVLRERRPGVRVILISADTSAQTLVAAVEAGADGFLPKSFPFTRLLQVVRRIDDAVIAEPLSLERALRYATTAPDPGDLPPAIEMTDREYEILLLLADGLPVKQVANRLHLSVHTCRGHVAALLRKFGVHSQLAAVIAAARMGLLPNLRTAEAADTANNQH